MGKVQELFEQLDEDLSKWHKFEEIAEKDRLHPSRFLCGYLKLASLLKEGAQSFDVGGADHDIIYLCHEDDIREDVTAEDILYLRRCGIHYSTEFDCLADFC